MTFSGFSGFDVNSSALRHVDEQFGLELTAERLRRMAGNINAFQPSFGKAVMQCCGLKSRMSLVNNDVLEKLNTFGLKIP